MNSKHPAEEKFHIVMEPLIYNVPEAEICCRHIPCELINEQFIHGGIQYDLYRI